ncbi:MAG: site-specific integrase [Actinomycetota bacterium]|nr:site-specific integrase [Actinomycetota bacterium]
MADRRSARLPGIDIRHAASCAAARGGKCACRPTYRAEGWVASEGRRIRKTFPTLAGAKAWRQDASVALREGTLSCDSSSSTLRWAAADWLTAAREGSIVNRSGDRYKPSTLRGYEETLHLRVLPWLGAVRVRDLTRPHLQRLVGTLMGEGLSASTVRNAIVPVRAICRHDVMVGQLAVNPTAGLQLPAVRGKRERVAPPGEVVALLKALPPAQRPLWATALYTGLRRGELMALRWSDIDLGRGLIEVSRSWDLEEGAVDPKSAAGVRRVPIPATLRPFLAEQRLRSRGADVLVFGRSATKPFNPRSISRWATEAWGDAGLEPVTLQECRHTFASLMIAATAAAGKFNPKVLQTIMGHSSITVTYDRYGHLFPGSEAEASRLLEAYLSADGAGAGGAASG